MFRNRSKIFVFFFAIKMEISNELLSKILSGDSSSKVAILDRYIENNTTPGSNHSSNLSRLTIEYQRKGKIFKKSFVLKVPSTHPMYNFGKRYKLYEKEYPIYTEVLEEMYKLDGEHIGPKLYYTDDKHSLMLKDLSQSGYKMADRIKQLDFDHCFLVLKKLARFHGLSVKLNQNSKINPFIKRSTWAEGVELDDCDKKFPRYVCEQLAKSLDPRLGLCEKIFQLKDDLYGKLCLEVNSNRYTFKVLNHGDLWSGNTLFKYDKYGDVAKVKFIDYQYSSWMSPVFDILGFTVRSMRFDVFERHFDFLMETYIDTLNKTLTFLQCDLYSLKELQSDMDNLPATLIMTLGARLPHIFHNPEDPAEHQMFAENGKVDYVRYEKFFKNELYVKVVNQWISYFAKKGWFDWE